MMIATQRQQKKNARYKKKIPGSGGKGQHDSDNHDRTPKQVPKIEDTPTPQSAVIVKVSKTRWLGLRIIGLCV